MRVVSACLLAGLAVTAEPALSYAQTSDSQPATVQSSASQSTVKAFKLKVGIGRFTNETRYGKSLLIDSDLDPLGKQASDILAAYLTQTGKFLVVERSDLSKIQAEGTRSGGNNIIGADTLILGSVVEFGQSEDGKRGFLNKQRTERARAKVAIRLVDVRTGVVFHSATGVGEATTETKTILGIGSVSRYDGTLADKALSVAVEDMLDELVKTLGGRPWRTDILAVKDGDIFITGGERQGLKPGDRLSVMLAGESVKSAQTGFEIPLPPKKLADAQVISTFGDNETNEGSVVRLVNGSIDGQDLKKMFVSAQ